MKKNILLILTLSFTLSACGENQNQNQNQQQSAVNNVEAGAKFASPEVNEAPKKIITSFYPVAFMAEKIVGEKGQVTNLAGSVDVHAYKLSPQDLVKLNQADLVVLQGAELEPWADSVIPELKDKGIAILEVSGNLELAKMEEHHDEHADHHDAHENQQDEHAHSEQEDNHHAGHQDAHEPHNDENDHAKHEEKHESHEDGAHDEHNHGEYDPHTWLDPVLAQTMVDEISEALISVDANNEATYRSNAIALKIRFAQLDHAYQQNLANCVNKKMIISHDAYGYLAKRYGFKFHSITGFSPQDEPSAKILAELKEEAREGVTHILIEENNIKRFADTLARETGLKTLPINPLGRGTLNPQKDFFDVMNDNLNSFKEALNCKS